MYIWSKLSSVRWRDAWEERFHGLGQTDAVIRDLKGGKSVRVEVYCKTKELADGIQIEFGGTVRKLMEQNWAHLPAAKVPPIKIRDALIILVSDNAVKIAQLKKKYPERHIISIPPEMAFGTGDHVTTAGCLRFLVDVTRKLNQSGASWDQLDLGVGSGILAIAGKLLGARRVKGIEYDNRALQVAKLNTRRNGVKDIDLVEENILTWKPLVRERNAYDCVTANLFSDVLVEAFPKIAYVAKPGGQIVVSGILDQQADECLAAGRKAGIRFGEPLRRGRWVTACGTRGPAS